MIITISINERQVHFSGGTISEYVFDEKNTSEAGYWPIIPEKKCVVFVEETLEGLKYIHDYGFVHGDIKGK